MLLILKIVSQRKSYVYAQLSCPSLFFLPGKESGRQLQWRLFSRSIVSGVSLLLCICSDPKMCFKMYLESSYTSKKAFAKVLQYMPKVWPDGVYLVKY